MKKNCIAMCVILGIVSACFLGLSVYGFVCKIYPLGGVACFLALVALWAFAGYICRESVREHFIARYRVRDYYGAKTVLDKASRNHLLYPFMRIALNQMYLRVELCLDDIPAAVKCAESLRRVGGEGWKYKTAYFMVLFNLDWSDISAARAEYESFRTACAHAEIYREQLAVLAAIFAHIDGQEVELPESVMNADYPILDRIARKYC